MTGILYRVAQLCVRRRVVVVVLWAVVTVALLAVSQSLGDNTNDNLSLPGTDSQHATDTLQKSFPDQANGTSPIVLHAPSGKLSDSKYASAVNTAAADVAKTKDVASVVNPLTPQGASALSKDGATGLPVGDAVGQARIAVQGRCPEHHRRGEQARPRRPASRWRRAASSARRSPSRRPNRASSWASSPR